MAEALALAEARALAAEGLAVSLRVAEAEGCVYLDLADDRWRVVEIDAHGVARARPGTCTVSQGRRDVGIACSWSAGSVDDLRGFVNVEDDRAWRLLVGWLLMSLSPRGPYPVLVLGGEHGTAKTWTANCLRELVDPNEAPNRAEPREPRDLMIAARNGWILAFDNISASRTPGSRTGCAAWRQAAASPPGNSIATTTK